MSTAPPTGPEDIALADEPSAEADFEIAVHRDEARHEYLALESDVEVATVQYTEAEGRVVLLTTTVVPAFRGRGIGDELIGYVLDDLRDRGARITVLCPVVRAFVALHSEYQEMLDPDRPDF